MFDGLIEDLDPEETGYIQFDELEKKWTQQMFEDEMEDHFDALEQEDEDAVPVTPAPLKRQVSIFDSVRLSK